MGSDAGWKVHRPRGNFTIITKDLKKALLFCKKRGAMAPGPPSWEALVNPYTN